MAKYTNITADTLIRTGGGRVHGVVINSHTNGTLKLWDNTSAASTIICNTITFAAGPQTFNFAAPIDFYTGLYADIGGTIDCTILWEPN